MGLSNFWIAAFCFDVHVRFHPLGALLIIYHEFLSFRDNTDMHKIYIARRGEPCGLHKVFQITGLKNELTECGPIFPST